MRRAGLVIAALGVGAAGCGGGKDAAPSVKTVTVVQPASTRQVQPPASSYRFRLPSGNIICAITTSVTCRVLSAGDNEYVLRPSGRATVRVSKGAVTIPARVLAYGTRVSRGPFVCRSSVAGLFCHVQGRPRGLFLSREQQLLNATPRAASPPSSPARPSAPPPPPSAPADKDFAVQDLQIKDDGLGDIGGIARVTNTSSQTLTATFTFTFFQGGQVVGTAIGSANEVGAGQTVTVQLSSQDPMISGRFHYEFQVDAQF